MSTNSFEIFSHTHYPEDVQLIGGFSLLPPKKPLDEYLDPSKAYFASLCEYQIENWEPTLKEAGFKKVAENDNWNYEHDRIYLYCRNKKETDGTNSNEKSTVQEVPKL
jgi:hypothetical protein